MASKQGDPYRAVRCCGDILGLTPLPEPQAIHVALLVQPRQTVGSDLGNPDRPTSIHGNPIGPGLRAAKLQLAYNKAPANRLSIHGQPGDEPVGLDSEPHLSPQFIHRESPRRRNSEARRQHGGDAELTYCRAVGLDPVNTPETASREPDRAAPVGHDADRVGSRLELEPADCSCLWIEPDQLVGVGGRDPYAPIRGHCESHREGQDWVVELLKSSSRDARGRGQGQAKGQGNGENSGYPTPSHAAPSLPRPTPPPPTRATLLLPARARWRTPGI